MQDIPASDILADGVLFDEKSTILLLAFLSSHLTNDERLVIFAVTFKFFPPCVKVLFRMHKASSLIHIESSKEFDQHEVGLQVCGD